MDIQDEQDNNRRSSGITFSFIGGAPQADGVSYNIRRLGQFARRVYGALANAMQYNWDKLYWQPLILATGLPQCSRDFLTAPWPIFRTLKTE
jgi:hypothetical protein